MGKNNRSRRTRFGWAFTVVLALLTTLVVVPLASSPVGATAAITTGVTAADWAATVMADPADLTAASYVTQPAGGLSSGTTEAVIGDFPTAGADYGILSTGDASEFDETGATASTNLSGANVQGDTDFDVTIVKLDFTVPLGANCMTGLDFRFYSDEFPGNVGGLVNDAFIAELDANTWTTSGNVISAPDNFAFDASGSEISVNAAGVTSMDADEATDTPFGGATPLLRARTPITPGAHSLYLSIFDQGDNVLDSAVAIDNISFGTVANPATDCREGADLLGTTATEFAAAVAATPAEVSGASYLSQPSRVTTAVDTGVGIISTGDASTFDDTDLADTEFDLAAVRGDDDFDVTTVKLDFTVPSGVNCMTRMDVQFFSQELPTGTFNDVFIAELDTSDWDTDGGDITAPNNFAFDSGNLPLSVASVGGLSPTSALAADTNFRYATPAMIVKTQITPGAHSIYLTIFDHGSDGEDSAVTIDNITFGTVLSPGTNCASGATRSVAYASSDFKYIALGDAFSSGEGLTTLLLPYLQPTNRCHRSSLAYPYLVDVQGQAGFTVQARSAAAAGPLWGFQPCSGASTRDVLRTGQWGDKLAQLATNRARDLANPDDRAVDAATDLVTLTIGSEDLRMRDVLGFCISNEDCTTARYRGSRLSVFMAAERVKLATQMTAVLTALETQAPGADVMVVGYPHLFPAGASPQNCSNLEQITDPERARRTLGFTNAEQDLLRTIVSAMNDTIEEAIEDAEFGEFVDTEALFATHEICGTGGGWIAAPTITFPARNGRYKLTDAEFHLTACGHMAIAERINSELNDTPEFIDC